MKYLAVAAALCSPQAGAAAQRLAVVGLYADSAVAAPVMELRGDLDDWHKWRVGLAAWTVNAEWERLGRERHSLFAAVELTPRDVASGERIWIDGERARELEFEGRSVELRAGWRGAVDESWSWVLAGLASSVALDSATPELEQRWRAPYAGAGGGLTFRRLVAEDPLSGELVGFELTGSARLLFGTEPWSRWMLAARAGQRLGALYLGESATVAGGHGLDRVNAQLVGGSWDTGGAATLYGYRYAEFRLESTSVWIALRADLAVATNWTVGLRASALAGGGQRAAGLGAAVTRGWRGWVASGGVYAGRSRDAPACCEPVVALSLGSALFILPGSGSH